MILLALSGALSVRAQGTSLPDSAEKDTYALVLYAGGGFSICPVQPGTPAHLDTRTSTLGPSGTVRLMWMPDHRLRLGFESGWTTFYSYTIEGPGETGRVDLVGVPLLITWSMPLTTRFSLFAGYGYYRMTSKLDYYGTTRVSTNSLGYAAALSYVHPLSDKLGIAAEVKWMNATEARQNLIAVQAQLVWKLHRW